MRRLLVPSCALLLHLPGAAGAAFAFSSHPRRLGLQHPRPSSSVHRGDGRRQRDVEAACHHPDGRLNHALGMSATDEDEGPNNNPAKYHEASVAGVSVSPRGFLAILRSTAPVRIHDEVAALAFPVLLTAAPPDATVGSLGDNPSSTSNGAAALPELFRENTDQTSVTSPEALTVLQLLNGVDMATPILPPDTLSLLCVWYAFFLEELDVEDGGGGGGSDIVVEDELGLSSVADDATDHNNGNSEGGNAFEEALEYVRAMVRTTLPPSGDGSYVLNYMDASPWQRSRIQLPRAWLHGVRLEAVDGLPASERKGHPSDAVKIGRVPIQFVLECSVDDGSKRLEVPLLAVPDSWHDASMPPHLQQKIDISNDLLQELTHNFNGETSASFMALALFHRYNKSGAGSADSPTLTFSSALLHQLVELQEEAEVKIENISRYCWVVPATDEGHADHLDRAIQANGLPLYRTLNQIQEEDQRVLENLKQQNFGGDAAVSASGAGGGTAQNVDPPRKKSLTLEQRALQQKLKSAWKIATQREDAGALEKIQKAMEDLERDVMDEGDDGGEEAGEDSALRKIRSAMHQDGASQDAVGLISELEEATNLRMEGTDSAENEEE